jgi:hypothetical protein
MPVLCIRHLGPETEWLATWRSLTALLFELGLAGPHTTAVGVIYEVPWRSPVRRIRYDACLTVDPSALGQLDLQDSFVRCPGLRYELIMGELPLARIGVRHTRRLDDMSVEAISGTAADCAQLDTRGKPGLGLPLYEVYPCSPVFLSDEVPVVELYQTVQLPRQPLTGRHPVTRRGSGLRSRSF